MATSACSKPDASVFDGWHLTPQGAAIHPGEATAVIADLHLGYEWARGAAGDCVVVHSLAETVSRLSAVLDHVPVTRLVIAGDLVESSPPCHRTSTNLRELSQWLSAQNTAVLVLEGNHDRGCRSISSLRALAGIPVQKTCQIGGWTIGHGHEPIPGLRTISGHHHPVLRAAATTSPCFLVGPGKIVLPAFSRNAAGCDVVSAAAPKEWYTVPLRCIVSTGFDLLDFGPLPDLRRRLNAMKRKPVPARRRSARRG